MIYRDSCPKAQVGWRWGRELFSTQETRLWSNKEATWSRQGQDPDPRVMGRGTLLGFQAAFSSSPSGSALEVLESQGGKTKATLTLGPRTCSTWPSRDRTGWLVVLIMATPCGTRNLVDTGPRADHSPVHFLWTWTLAYSEKDGSGLGAGCARLRWTMSRSA